MLADGVEGDLLCRLASACCEARRTLEAHGEAAELRHSRFARDEGLQLICDIGVWRQEVPGCAGLSWRTCQS